MPSNRVGNTLKLTRRRYFPRSFNAKNAIGICPFSAQENRVHPQLSFSHGFPLSVMDRHLQTTTRRSAIQEHQSGYWPKKKHRRSLSGRQLFGQKPQARISGQTACLQRLRRKPDRERIPFGDGKERRRRRTFDNSLRKGPSNVISIRKEVGVAQSLARREEVKA